MLECSTKVMVYSFICIVGVIGNLFMLFAISKVTLMRTITKKLLANLVFIDLLINVIRVPNSIIKVIRPDFNDDPYSVAFIRCKVMPYIGSLLFLAFINTLMALTIDRYIAIVHPLRNITKTEFRITMILIWSLAAIYRTPEMLLTHLNNKNKMECELNWPSKSFKYVYYFFDATEVCLLPTGIVIYCYVVIWKVLKNHRIPGERTGNERALETMEANRMKSINSIFVNTMYFIISVIPCYIAYLTYELARQEQNQMRHVHPFHIWLDCVALAHFFMIPLLCCLTNSFVRNSMKNSIKCGFGARPQPYELNG